MGCFTVLKQPGYTGVLSLETEDGFDAEQRPTPDGGQHSYLVEALTGI